MTGGTRFDHVAIAVERLEHAWPRYVGDLGGRWLAGTATAGFATGQLTYAGGAKVEILQPNRLDEDDFLRRFLDRHGPGPHHLTFLVDDLEATLASVEGAGYRPVGVDLSDPWWREAFLHPRQAGGVSVQLAETEDGSWRTPPPAGFPAQPGAPASLRHVGHVVASLHEAMRLFCDLLGGVEVGRGAGEASRWVELAWPGPGRLRLLEPTSPASPLHRWLGGRPGRVRHLAFACRAPSSIEGAVAVGEGAWEIPPERAQGTVLALQRSGG